MSNPNPPADRFYTVLRPIKFEGVRREPGTLLQLDDDEAEQMIADGDVGEEPVAPDNPTTTSGIAASAGQGGPADNGAKPVKPRVVRKTTTRRA